MSALLLILCVAYVRICSAPRRRGVRRSLRRVCVSRCRSTCPDWPLIPDVCVAVFALSCLSTPLPVGATGHNNQLLSEFMQFVEDLHCSDSDVKLYAPSSDDISETCMNMTLLCFIRELEVVMFENDYHDNCSDKSDFLSMKLILPSESSLSRCKLCELHEMTNSTVFLKRFHWLLQMMVTQNHG